MPIYEYSCQACGHHFEKFQRLSDEVLSLCPQCGKSELIKLVSAAGFRLKGQGWYETDYKTGNKRNLTSNDNAKPTAKAGDKQEKKDHNSAKTVADTKSGSSGDKKSGSSGDKKSGSSGEKK